MPDNKAACCRTTQRPETLKSDLSSRLSRIEGQVRGISRMIESDTYCDDVLIQIRAAESALGSVAKLVLGHHMRHCLVERVQTGDTAIVDELLSTLGTYL